MPRRDTRSLQRASLVPIVSRTFAELGYRPVGEAGDRAVVPTYSPGLPLLMAAAKLAGGQAAMFVVVPLLGAAMVWCTYRLGVRVTTPWFALLAAALVATSPPFLSQLVVPMSDVPAAAFWSLAALGVHTQGLHDSVRRLLAPR